MRSFPTGTATWSMRRMATSISRERGRTIAARKAGAHSTLCSRMAVRYSSSAARRDGYPGPARTPRVGPLEAPDTPRPSLAKCYSMLAGTGGRIGFQLAPQVAFLDWTTRSIRAGQTIYLLVETDEGEPVAGATFYRHGDRLTYALSGDRADKRREFPGAIRLLVWRGIQLAVREGRRTMDLGGVDVPGARRKPRKGE